MAQPPKLTPAAKAKAFAAIQSMYKACIGKDGITALTEKLFTKHETASSYIYSLGVFAATKEKKLPAANALFVEMCDYAEGELKAKLNVSNLRDAVGPWATYKSTLRRGMNLGLSPLDFPTERAFRVATVELHHPTPEVVGPERVGPVEVGRFLTEETTIAKGLQGMLQRLMVEAQFIKRGNVEEAEKIFADASEKLAALLDHKTLAKMDEKTREFLVPGSVQGSAEVASTLQ